jgi:hypothetical protein
MTLRIVADKPVAPAKEPPSPVKIKENVEQKLTEKVKEPDTTTPAVVKTTQAFKEKTKDTIEKKEEPTESKKDEKPAAPSKAPVEHDPITTRKKSNKKKGPAPQPTLASSQALTSQAPNSTLPSSRAFADSAAKILADGGYSIVCDGTHFSLSTPHAAPVDNDPSTPKKDTAARNKRRAEKRAKQKQEARDAAAAAQTPEAMRAAEKIAADLQRKITLEVNAAVARGALDAQRIDLGSNVHDLEEIVSVDAEELEGLKHEAEVVLRDAMTALYGKGVYFKLFEEDFYVSKQYHEANGGRLTEEDEEGVAAAEDARDEFRHAWKRVVVREKAETKLKNLAKMGEAGWEERIVAEARKAAFTPTMKQKMSRRGSSSPSPREIVPPVVPEQSEFDFSVPTGLSKTAKAPLSKNIGGSSPTTSSPLQALIGDSKTPSFDFNMPVPIQAEKLAMPTSIFGVALKDVSDSEASKDVDMVDAEELPHVPSSDESDSTVMPNSEPYSDVDELETAFEDKAEGKVAESEVEPGVEVKESPEPTASSAAVVEQLAEMTVETPSSPQSTFPSPPGSVSSSKDDEATSANADSSRRRLNAQIGITTLREFMYALPDATAAQVSKEELVEAFLALSSAEREALDLGPAHIQDAAAVLSRKYLQHKVFLGHVKLAEFLGAVEFDAEGMAADHAVLTAFEVCAEKDKKAEALEMRVGGV